MVLVLRGQVVLEHLFEVVGNGDFVCHDAVFV